MEKKTLYRSFLLAAGLLVVFVIVFSQTIQKVEVKKSATEQTDNKEEATYLQAPAEAITQGQAVKIGEQLPEQVLAVITLKSDETEFIPPVVRISEKLFKILFQVLIAPNAP